MNTLIKFPKDFTKITHPVVPNGVQFTPKKEQLVFISVVGGTHLYGDGINTFELMIGNKVHGHLSKDEVNEKIYEVLSLIDVY